MYDNVMSVLQNRWIQALGALIVLALVLFLIYLVSPLLTPVFLALLAAYLLNPVVDMLSRRLGFSRFFASSSLLAASIAAIILLPLMLIPRIVSEAEQMILLGQSRSDQLSQAAAEGKMPAARRLIELLPMKEFVLLMNWDADEAPAEPISEVEPQNAEPSAEETETDTAPVVVIPAEPREDAGASSQETPVVTVVAAPRLTYEQRSTRLSEPEAWRIVARRIGLFVRGNVASLLQRYSGQVAGAIHVGGSTLANILHRVWDFLVGFLAFLVNFSVFTFATLYLLVSYESLTRRLREMIPPKHKAKTLSIVDKIDFQLRSFVRGQAVVALADAAVYCIGLSIARVPFALVIGLVAGVLSFFPYVGVTLGLVSSVILVLVTHGIGWNLIVVALTFLTVQALEEIYLRPVIVGDKVGLHPVWVMASFLVFGNALGFLGILAAVPIAAILKVFVVEGYAYYRASKFYRAHSG